MTLPTEITAGDRGHRIAHVRLHRRANATVCAGDFATLQEAIDAAVAGGCDCVIPAGRYTLTETLNIAEVEGVHIRGAGCGEFGGGTTLNWAGADNVPAVLLSNTRRVLLSDFRLTCSEPAAVGLSVLNAGSGITPTACRFENVAIDGISGGRLGKGWTVGGVDANNDFHIWTNCAAANYATAGWSFEASQSLNHMLINCKAAGAGGLYGVANRLGPNAHGGSFHWIGGAMSNHAEADFYVGGYCSGGVSIENAQCEGSARLLSNPGPHGVRFPIAIRGTRFNPRDNLTEFIYQGGPGPLLVEGCTFEAYTDEQAGVMRIDAGGFAPVTATFIGCIVQTVAAEPFPATARLIDVHVVNRATGEVIAL